MSGLPGYDSLFSLTAKRILLTGATGHLGQAMAEGLAAFGASPVLLSRSEKLDDLAASLSQRYKKKGIRVETYRIDLYDRVGLATVVRRILDGGRLYGLVNNAFDISSTTGFHKVGGAFDQLDHESWLGSMDCGTFWPFALVQHFLPHFIESGGGTIVNIASMYGVVSPDPDLYDGTDYGSPVNYGCAKAALLALTRYIAAYYGSKGIRCNAISPGPFPNEKTMMAGPSAAKARDFIEKLSGKTLLGRIGRPEELIGTLVFLLSAGSSYITGQNILVDGGWTVR